MKRTEFIAEYNKLTEEQKTNLNQLGYYSTTTLKHYGLHASYSLHAQQAPVGFYVPFNFLLKSKQYDWKGAKVYGIHFAMMKEDKVTKHQEFGGFFFGKVVHIGQIKHKDGTPVKAEEMKQEDLVTA